MMRAQQARQLRDKRKCRAACYAFAMMLFIIIDTPPLLRSAAAIEVAY